MSVHNYFIVTTFQFEHALSNISMMFHLIGFIGKYIDTSNTLYLALLPKSWL